MLGHLLYLELLDCGRPWAYSLVLGLDLLDFGASLFLDDSALGAGEASGFAVVLSALEDGVESVLAPDL